MYAGIDPAGREKPFTLAVLDEHLQQMQLEALTLEETLERLRSKPSGRVGINGPIAPAKGLVRAQKGGRGYGVNMRLAEFALRERGFPVNGTPADERLCPEWMQATFALYRTLQAEGWLTYPQPGERQVLETNATVAFWSLVGGEPLPRLSLEGRLQRQSVLYDEGLPLRDPMLFFEEITRHRLRQGRLPWDWVYRPAELDALVAAYTAYLVAIHPEQTWSVGAEEEGVIVLPGVVKSAT